LIPFMKLPALISALLCMCGLVFLQAQNDSPVETKPEQQKKNIYVIPVKGDIDASIIYIIRRGVKEAMEAEADAVILHMDTYGGRVDITEEIFKVLNRFPKQDQLYTYIDTRAGSAGSIISAASHKIYMSPGSVIGAAAVVTGSGSELSETMNLKLTSFLKGVTRAQAERQGLRPEVFEAMIDPEIELVLDGKVISPKGSLLSLTSQEAAQTYSTPPRPLISSGTIDSLEKLVEIIGGADAVVTKIEPTGFEQVGAFIVMLSPFLLAAATLCGYIEFKTPGFGFFGITAIICALIFFFGHYVAGLSGYGFAILFVIGVLLILVELFLFPGTLLPGLAGICLIAVSLLKAMVDKYPSDPFLPTAAQLQDPLTNLGLSLALSVAGVLVLMRLLPRTPLYSKLVLSNINDATVPVHTDSFSPSIGSEGTTLTFLRPSGTADFGQGPVDVVTEGIFIETGIRVRVTEHVGIRTVVEPV